MKKINKTWPILFRIFFSLHTVLNYVVVLLMVLIVLIGGATKRQFKNDYSVNRELK
jgi:general stress protein CsbA